MKKIISGLIAGAMFLQSGAFADDIADLKGIFQKQYTNATVDFSGKITLDKPLDVLGALESDYDDSISTGVFGSAIDYQRAAESLFGTTENVQLKLNSSDDYKKIDMSMSGNAHIPVEVNENLKITTDASYGIWLSMDWENADDFVYQMTLKSPLSKKYVTMDIAKIMKEQGTPAFDLTNVDLKAIQEKSVDIIGELIKRDAKVSKNANTYTVQFDNAGFISFIDDYVQAIFAMSKEIVGDSIDEEMFVMPDDTKEMLQKLKEIKILGDNGMTIELTANLGNIENMKITCDFEMNVYDIAQKFTDEIPENITHENSDVDFTLELNYKYSQIGSTTVEFPELNEKNSFSMNDVLDGDGDYNNDYLYDGEYYETYSLPGYLVNGVSTVPYLHLREVIDDYAWCCGDYDYGYFLEGADELSWNDGVATFTDSKGTLKFDSFSLDSKTGDAYLNGEKLDLSNQTYKHIIIKENNMYISPELANKLFGIDVTGYTVDFNIFGTPTWAHIDYQYPNPHYNAQV